MNAKPEVQTQVKAILGPIAALLRSRKFVASFGAILVSILIVRVPDLAPYADTLILGIMLVAAVLTGSIALEDSAARKAAAIEAAGRTQQQNTQKAIEAGVDVLFNPPVPAKPATPLPPVDPHAQG